MIKRISLFIFLLLTLPLYAEINYSIGIGGGYNNLNADYSEYKYTGNAFELPLQLGVNYFNTKDNRFGFGANIALNFITGNIELKRTDGEKIIMYDNTEIKGISSEKYYFEKNKTPKQSSIFFSPSIFYRTKDNDKGIIFSIGPGYSYSNLDFYRVSNSTIKDNRTVYQKAISQRVLINRFNIYGEIGFYNHNNKEFEHKISLYYKIGDFEKSYFTNNTFKYIPNFSIGIIFKISGSSDTDTEIQQKTAQKNKEREEERKKQEEEARLYIEEQNRKYNEKQEKILQEEQYFANKVGKDVIRLQSHHYNNPHAFDRNVIYHYVDALYVHDWMSQGFIAGTYPKSNNMGNDSKFYIYSVPDISKISDRITDVYMQYLGTQEFTNALGGTVILPVFSVIQNSY